MKKWVMWMAVAVVAVSVVGYGIKAAQKPVLVEIETVQKGQLEKVVEETAEVRLKDQMTAISLGAGKVTAVHAEVGDKVNKGQNLAEVDAETVLLQKEELLAEKNLLEAQYREARKAVSASELNKLDAQVKADLAALEESKKTLTNNSALLQSGAISDEAYQSSRVAVAGKEAAWLASTNNLIKAREALAPNVRAQYIAKLKSIEARMALLDKQGQDLGVKAPLSGVVLTRSVEAGSYVQPGQKLFEIGAERPIKLVSDVLMEDIKDIHAGTTVRLFSKELGLTDLPAAVVKVYPSAFTKVSDLGINQKRVTVEMLMDQGVVERAQILKPGYELTAQFIISQRSSVLTLDKKAIFDHSGHSAVFIVKDGIARLQEIEKGLEGEKRIEVLKGLTSGDQVIVSPDDKLKEGTAVKGN